MSKWEKFFWGSIACGMILWLGACSVARPLFDACREGLCR